MTSPARMPRAASRASTARPAWGGRASGKGRATSARKNGSREPSMRARQQARHEAHIARSGLGVIMDIHVLALAALAAFAVGGLAFVFVYPLLSGERKAEKRQAALTSGPAKKVIDKQADAAARRKQV